MASGSSSSRKSLPAPDGVSLLLSHLVPDGGGGEKTRVAEDKTQSARTSSLLAPLSQGGYIDIVTITHAERMDTVFPAWLRLAYRGGGELYTPWDLNMPASIPRRPVAHYRGDPPITVHGATTAGLLGCGLRKSIVVVGNPGAIIYSRGQGPRAAEKLWKLCEGVEPLSVHAIRVGNNKVLEGQLRLLPLTPTVFKAREVERLAKKAKD
ncbi:unnamed protein product, partial [Mesorhabditis spiculigera]